MMAKKSKGAVEWILPNKKRPIAYSTKAVKDLVNLLAQDYTTVRELHDAINYDRTAIDILQKYIDAGYGGAVAKDMFFD